MTKMEKFARTCDASIDERGVPTESEILNWVRQVYATGQEDMKGRALKLARHHDSQEHRATGRTAEGLLMNLKVNRKG